MKKYDLCCGLRAACRQDRERLADFIYGLLREEAGEEGTMTAEEIAAVASVRFSPGEAVWIAEEVVRLCE